MSLANQLLIASPSLDNTEFSHSVIYICEHHEQGTVGLIINQPMKYSLGLVFNQLDINPIDQEKNQLPLLYGGPNQSERGFVMHRPKGSWHSSLDLLPNDVTITTSNDIIRAIAEDRGPKDALVVLGYVGWAENQLESEIINDSWIVCPFKSEILYQEPFETRWEAAGMSMGINMNQLVAGAGHA
jgi:putative transcriptional regulator